MHGLLASGHEVGMVGSCPYLDATTIYSARYIKPRGTGPMVIVQAVGHNKVQADVEAVVLNVQGGIHTCDIAQDDGLILSGHTINCGLGMCAVYAPDVTVDITCAEIWQDM